MFDTKCLALAEYFLSDHVATPEQTNELAQLIQDRIEGWDGWESLKERERDEPSDDDGEPPVTFAERCAMNEREFRGLR